MKIETGAPEFTPDQYSTMRRDRVGDRLSRNVVVARRLADTRDGERTWELECMMCSRHFALSDKLIEDPRTIVCGCNQRKL
jgi:DNA-directed RNA polymerase subunit RPC12/RpoP